MTCICTYMFTKSGKLRLTWVWWYRWGMKPSVFIYYIPPPWKANLPFIWYLLICVLVTPLFPSLLVLVKMKLLPSSWRYLTVVHVHDVLHKYIAIYWTPKCNTLRSRRTSFCDETHGLYVKITTFTN